MASTISWYGHVLKSEAGHILRWALEFEVEGKIKGALKGHRMRLRNKVGLSRKDALSQ